MGSRSLRAHAPLGVRQNGLICALQLESTERPLLCRTAGWRAIIWHALSHRQALHDEHPRQDPLEGPHIHTGPPVPRTLAHQREGHRRARYGVLRERLRLVAWTGASGHAVPQETAVSASVDCLRRLLAPTRREPNMRPIVPAQPGQAVAPAQHSGEPGSTAVVNCSDPRLERPCKPS
jgi:hypothetical protein